MLSGFSKISGIRRSLDRHIRTVGACVALCLVALTSLTMVGPAQAATLQNTGSLAQVLYRFEDRPLILGRYGSASDFQTHLFVAAARCAGAKPSQYGKADGIVGAKTRQAILDLRPCLDRDAKSAIGMGDAGGNSDGNTGAITVGLWKLLMPADQPYPDAIERANHLTFALEGTDYDAIQFNFCQSRNPRSGKRFLEGDPWCYTNDPNAYLTWGPRGATAGAGAEIQQIVFAAERANPGLLKAVFGPHTDAMHRLALGNNQSAFDILCAIWIDPKRRVDFTARFAKYGALAEVQHAYRRVYDAANADGGKIARFFKVYAALKPIIGRDPTEIDLAFFIDRATHGMAPPGDVSDLVAKMVNFASRTRKVPSPGTLRRQLAAWLPSQHKYNDRIARDAIFLIDDPEVILSDTHRRIWQQRSGLRASDFGLSDDRTITDYPVAAPTGFEQIERFYTVLPADKRACPANVRKSRRP